MSPVINEKLLVNINQAALPEQTMMTGQQLVYLLEYYLYSNTPISWNTICTAIHLSLAILSVQQ